MMQRRSLGKGLSALIPQVEPEKTEKIVELGIGQIRPNRYQPREDFDEEKLKELADSIKTKGMVQPIVVTHLDKDSYEIVAGERRLRAVKSLGFKTIPAIIRKLENLDLLEFSLIENLQRQNLNPIEEAKAFAFTFEWVKTLRKFDIGGVGDCIKEKFEFRPAKNGLHDLAFAFVDFMAKNGRKAFELHDDLAKRYVSIFNPVYK